jgi:hypothetical protein
MKEDAEPRMTIIDGTTQEVYAGAVAREPEALLSAETPEAGFCCAPAEQRTCCAAEDKAECCGTWGGGGCGCR